MRRAMIRPKLTLAIVLVLAPGVAPAAEQVVDGRAFTLPDGFVVERVAGPPLVDRPITADFDEQGRLYVADSSGSNEKVEVQLAEKPHRIVRLEDTDGDGRFDRSVVFAERMMFPEGTLWHDGSLYVAAAPSIWKLTDTDGDGVADRRVEWFRGKTLTGCANDLHGPYLGPDGWIYWCKGGFAQQTYERPGKSPFDTRASHIFRARPDGTGVEPVMTGGMDNPVDVVFTAAGERIFSCTFLQHPANGRRDGLIHAVYGGVYGKVHDVLDGHVRTGPDVLPPMTHLGPAAACGLATYRSFSFGPDFRGNLFACCFNLRKVTRHVLKPEGATFRTEDSDFLATTDTDFHPTDVLEDADGSLIVVDTGGWYKLCCPTSQLPKPDVLGAIYRVRKPGARRVRDPRGLAIDWSNPEAVRRHVFDSRQAVRRRAIATMAKLGRVPEVTDSTERVGSVWTACRIDSPEARAFVRKALADPEANVRQAACHASSVWRDAHASDRLAQLLRDPSFQVRRAAAEALGRCGDRHSAPLLLNAAAGLTDPILEHSITYALIEMGDAVAVAPGLDHPDPVARRVALVALDQLGSDQVTAEIVAPLLASADPKLREVASWVVGRHREWAGALAATFRERLEMGGLAEEDRAALVDQLARFAGAPPVQEVLAAALGNPAARDVVLRALSKSGLKQPPKALVDALGALLHGRDLGLLAEAVKAVRALGVRDPKVGESLERIGADPDAPASLRLDALGAVYGRLAGVDPGVFSFLLDRLDPRGPVADRTAAADVLWRVNLTAGQLSAVADAVRQAGPIEIEKLLTIFEQTRDEAVGLKLVEALKASPARAALRVNDLRVMLDKFGPAARARAEALYASLSVADSEKKAHLEEILPSLESGDVRRGQAVFNGTKAGCLTCHAMGYVGGKVGPDLTHIGQIRTDRDLLEAIVYPSLSFVRSYEPVAVATRDGRVVSGLLRKDSADEVVLAVNATDELHLRRDEIDEMRPGTVSVMPAGFDQQLTRQELADLIAFLKSRK